uniref:Uncharacterized protein n=1 Tax=Candidatus Kentrum sp. LFY TaxID=2126342 RepID=A0A450UEZ0_9GAMM|nr:MAG: hypothetical protein BECKLFY1418B_GA0070995_102334 [Candidatus Kentron sp. LFY]
MGGIDPLAATGREWRKPLPYPIHVHPKRRHVPAKLQEALTPVFYAGCRKVPSNPGWNSHLPLFPHYHASQGTPPHEMEVQVEDLLIAVPVAIHDEPISALADPLLFGQFLRRQ